MRAFVHSTRILTLCCGLLLTAVCGRNACAEPTGFLDKILVEGGSEHRFAVYIPDDYDPARQWPVILYLHGAGYSGADGRQHLASGLAQVVREQGNFPAIVVFPQCEELDAPLLTRWQADSPDGRRALRMLDRVQREYSVDSSRCALAGWSMGGYGAWSLAAADPDRWSAVVAVSGGGNPQLASKITAPVWAIHGAADRAILPVQSQRMVDAVNAAGGQATLTVLDDVSHDAWRYAFLSPTVRNWMLAPNQEPPDSDRLRSETTEFIANGQAEALDGEFQPALIIPRAISLSVDNDVLRTLASGAPAAIDPALLTGKLDDQSFEFAAVGEVFRVELGQMAFRASLKRVLAETLETGSIRFQVGLEPLEVTIGQTDVQSATRTAHAGPTTIRIGNRYPFWIEAELRPSVEAGRLRLRADRTNFHIPDANWVVLPPDEVTVSGPDLTPDLAQAALVGGLYLHREQIEQYIHNAIPGLVQSLEHRLQPTRVDRILTSVWPLPVFRPRLRVQPEEIVVDGQGLSLVLGIEAAPFRNQPHPSQPLVTAPMGPHAAELRNRSGLEIGVSPGVLESLSSMVVNANAAHIDVRDMPEPEFRLLADRAELTRILPALATLEECVELRTELNLTAPLVVERADIAAGVQFTSVDERTLAAADTPATLTPDVSAPHPLAARFEIPDLEVTVMTRDPSADQRWNKFAVFDVQLDHEVRLQLSATGHQKRVVRLSWNDDPQIQVAGGYADSSTQAADPVDRQHLGKLVHDCWNAWTGGDTVINEEVPDLVLGTSHLRIDSLAWRDAILTARFQTPQTRIVNSGPRQIEYAVRSPFSPWSPRYRLQPGESDVFSSQAALTVRRFPQPIDAAIEIPVGSEFDLADTGR